MEKTTVALVCVVLMLFAAIFGSYAYRVRAENRGDWQQPRLETERVIVDVKSDPKDSSKPVEPIDKDKTPTPPPKKKLLKPNPTPIMRPGYILPGKPKPSCGSPDCPNCGNGATAS